MSSTPPPLHGPTSKERKYDRQLRLWAASGQAALEDAHVLLVNAGAGVVGIEALKNLVLPGIGAFTVLDQATVAEADLGVNFFLEQESLGKSRAQETCRCLRELNPDVDGHFLHSSLSTLLEDPSKLSPYSLILVASPIKSEHLARIANYCHDASKPLFYVRSVGFYGSFSIQLPHAFPVVDTHPDPDSTTDLRLLKPWPSLIKYATSKSRDLENMADHEHGHVPYLVLILHYLSTWKESHEGRVPSSYKEKTEFKALLLEGMRTKSPEGGEENFEEAVGAVLKNLNEPIPSSAVREVFNAPECLNLTSESPDFWVIARAVSDFYQKHSVLPLPGTVPDMKAQSADYMELQTVYKSKARQDSAEVLEMVRKLEADLGRTKKIDEKEVDAFCKGAGHIKLVRGRPLLVAPRDKSIDWSDGAKRCANALTDETSQFLLYIALLAYDMQYDQNGAAPSVQSSTNGASAMTRYTTKIVDELLERGEKQLDMSEKESVTSALADICSEISRAGGGELHSISALVGGLVAQEIIKVIAKQYIPVDNTCLFDGIKSTSSVLRV